MVTRAVIGGTEIYSQARVTVCACLPSAAGSRGSGAELGPWLGGILQRVLLEVEIAGIGC